MYASKKRILLLGSTGKLGSVVLKMLLVNHYEVTVLVRSPERILIRNQRLKIIKGEVVKKNDLGKALNDVEVVVSTLGHGFRTPHQIQSITLESLIPLMNKNGIKRVITVTGAALKTKEDPYSFILDVTQKALAFIDPYRMEDSIKQQELLEKSDLDWTSIRTPVHRDGGSTFGNAGYKQPPPWRRVSRKAVANFILDCIENKSWYRKSPIFY